MVLELSTCLTSTNDAAESSQSRRDCKAAIASGCETLAKFSHYYFIKELPAVTGERGPKTPRLVDLDAPLALLLQVGDEVIVRQALLAADLLQHILIQL